jgi:hypothetical protein
VNWPRTSRRRWMTSYNWLVMGRLRCAHAPGWGLWGARPVFGLPDRRLTARLPSPKASGCA